MKKLASKYHYFIFNAFMSAFMSFLISGILLVLNNGGADGEFILKWGKSFGVSFSIAYPVVLIVMPLAYKVTDFFVVKK